MNRDAITLEANPHKESDYLVTLSVKGAVEILVRYVPNATILEPQSFYAYLDRVRQNGNLSQMAFHIINDLNNTLIPRWVRAELRQHSAGGEHAVTMEDRQPRWDNTALLARLAPL